jgi:hypothetical protein
VPDPGPAAFDERSVRLAQGALGIVLLAAFVFRIPLLVPIAAINEVIGAAVGPHAAPLHLAYNPLLRYRLGDRLPARAPVAPDGIRAQHVLAVVLLGVAALAFLVGIDLIGWLFTLLEAGVAVTEATIGVNAALALRERLNRD